ncbi:MAG TPA: glutathione S-transferase family protein [Alphaproteobacteria bacterium]|nr:glutathione S-transferase family protein [Alphaproteobacteria bacterium]
MHQADLQPARKKSAAKPSAKVAAAAEATITISSKNYSSWCLRGWLLCKFAGLEVAEKMIPADDPSARAELLLLSPSFLVPCLTHNGVKVWDTISIAEYLNEIRPKAGLWPADRAARAFCRSISGEMHSGFASMRAALPMNLKGHFPGFRIWANAQADIDRILQIWHECFATYKGPYLFGAQRTVADAMYAPVVTRFLSYDVKLDAEARAFAKHIMAMPEMVEWVEAAKGEPDELEELDVEF